MTFPSRCLCFASLSHGHALTKLWESEESGFHTQKNHIRVGLICSILVIPTITTGHMMVVYNPMDSKERRTTVRCTLEDYFPHPPSRDHASGPTYLLDVDSHATWRTFVFRCA
jgi:hypothetical protein